MRNPDQYMLQMARRVLRYLRGTRLQGITWTAAPGNDRKEALDLIGYCDSDWAGDLKTRKSTSGCVVRLGGGPIAWRVQRQRCVSLSTCEAEYVAICLAAKTCVGAHNIVKILAAVGHPVRDTVKIYSDNDAAIVTGSTVRQNNSSRHIELRYHYVRDCVKRGRIQLARIGGAYNPADLLTKPATLDAVNRLLKQLLG
jgi:hypothetical protein